MKLRCDFPVTLVICVLAIAATAASFAWPGVQAALTAGGPWRVVTGPFVHATWGHLVRDLSLVALAGVPYEARLVRWRLALFGGGIVLPALAVLVARDASWYCGLSGLSHALLAAALAYEAMHRQGRTRAIVRMLCVIAALKPLYELLAGAPAFPMSLGRGVAQVPLAHVVGVLVGIACGLSQVSRPAEPGAPPRRHAPSRARRRPSW